MKKQFGLTEKNVQLFPELPHAEPTDHLKVSLQRVKNSKIAYFSEKSRSEALVFPILLEVQILNHEKFAVYSGAVIDADKERGLNGECDFVLSKGEQSIELDAPFFCLVEAKDNDIDLGVPQCIAQMLGARIFNEQEGKPLPVIYGCVTTGEQWLFLKLEGDTIFIDNTRYPLENLTKLLGVLNWIVGQFK
ncbi:MAG: hypothetical protein ACK4Q5_07000 [Saprospiraceae bacterium]